MSSQLLQEILCIVTGITSRDDDLRIFRNYTDSCSFQNVLDSILQDNVSLRETIEGKIIHSLICQIFDDTSGTIPTGHYIIIDIFSLIIYNDINS